MLSLNWVWMIPDRSGKSAPWLCTAGFEGRNPAFAERFERAGEGLGRSTAKCRAAGKSRVIALHNPGKLKNQAVPLPTVDTALKRDICTTMKARNSICLLSFVLSLAAA